MLSGAARPGVLIALDWTNVYGVARDAPTVLHPDVGLVALRSAERPNE